jgi:phosphate transport system substrate-binding protein
MWQVIILLIGMVIAAILSLVAASWSLRDRTRTYRISIAICVTLVLASLIFFFSSPGGSPQGPIPLPSANTNLPTCIAGSISIDGSTALLPLAQDVATNYKSHCPSAQITVSGGGSQQGVNDVENGTVDIGDSDVPAPVEPDYSDLSDHVVAVVIYVLIVHQGVGITNLTIDQIQKIYNGAYTNWVQLGRASQPITAISREIGSGTRATFDKYILGGSEKSTLQPATSTQKVVQDVQTIPGAIGYVSLHDAQANSTNLSIVSINGYPYTAYTNNSYTFWNLEHMYTKGSAGGASPFRQLAQAFLNYMGNTSVVKQIILDDSFISVYDMSSGTLSTHYP